MRHCRAGRVKPPRGALGGMTTVVQRCVAAWHRYDGPRRRRSRLPAPEEAIGTRRPLQLRPAKSGSLARRRETPRLRRKDSLYVDLATACHPDRRLAHLIDDLDGARHADRSPHPLRPPAHSSDPPMILDHLQQRQQHILKTRGSTTPDALGRPASDGDLRKCARPAHRSWRYPAHQFAA